VVAEILRLGRHAPDRLLHPLRRRAARAELTRRVAPSSLLVICHGNICRSPFAAAMLRARLAGTGACVESAGFFGPGRRSPDTAIAAAWQWHQDLRPHRSRLLTLDLVRAMDLLIVMDATQRRDVCDRFGRHPRDVFLLGDLDPRPIRTRAIEDPIERPLAVYEEVYARIERCIATLAGVLRNRARPAVRSA
jgi:protein-tyrosine phosphatase